MKLIYFVINSRIQSKKIEYLLKCIKQKCSSFNVITAFTQYGGHAGILTQEAINKKAYIIVSVGGDGTLNEVLQHIMNADIQLGIIPMGSGNGLARHCSIPLHINEALDTILHGKPILIDIAKANNRYFISNAGVGFDASVCNLILNTSQRGLWMYIRKVFLHYFSYKPYQYTVTLDETSFTTPAFFLNIANGKEFGYGFTIAENASLQDGLLDIILLKKMNLWIGLQFVLNGWRKKLNSSTYINHYKSKKIEITSPQMKFFQVDGDIELCESNCIISIHTKKLQLIVPPHISQA